MGEMRKLGAVKAATMAAPRAQGNRAEALFPRLLRGLYYALNPVEESALEKRVDLLLELLDRGFALDLLAVDEEGRRRINLQHLARIFLVGGDLVEQRLVLQALFDLLLGQAGLLADPRQALGGVLHHPVVLRLEQEVGHSEIFVGIAVGDAARQHRARGRLDVER